MEILSSRVHLAARDLPTTRRFYEETLGLHVYREYGAAGVVTGLVLFAGGGFLELGQGDPDAPPAAPGVFLWWQVADLAATCAEVRSAGVAIDVPPRRMPWGLDEAWIRDPDGVRIVLVEVPPEHPLRRRVD